MLSIALLLFALQTPAADLATIRKQVSEAEDAFYASLDKLPEAEREQAYGGWGRTQGEFFDKAEALAGAHAREEIACEALVWIVTAAGPGERATRSFERLLADFPANERLAEIPAALVYVNQVFVAGWLERLADEVRPPKVRGRALLALAQHRTRALEAARMLRQGGEKAGHLRAIQAKDWLARLEALDLEAEKLAIESLFERVQKEFAEVDCSGGKLGAIAKACLFELRDLAIGRIAPEIEGHDTEGVPFKLSDYRGKVVLLDFWGHW